MTLYGSSSDSVSIVGQPLPECPDVVEVLRRAGSLQCKETWRLQFGQVDLKEQTQRCDTWLRLIDVLNLIRRRI